MRAYMFGLESILGTKPQLSWTCIEKTHPRSYDHATHTHVPRHTGGEDFAMYVCISADLTSHRQSPAEAEQILITDAKQCLKKRYHRTTPNR